MREESLTFLQELLRTPSPSGYEQAIQEVCRDYMAPLADRIYKDVHGNQYHVLNPDAPTRIMLAGHVDEIGLMVNTINDDGFIGFVAIGGVDPAVLGGQRVKIGAAGGPLSGVIGRKAIHLMEKEERGKPLELHQMWIDIGAASREEAEEQVTIGDSITIDAGYLDLLNGRVVARALDDRIGAFVCLEATRMLAEERPEVAVYCVTTVQEEIGLRGAITSSYGCEPQAGIAVDVAWATDHPNGEGERYGFTQLGGGPIISRGPNINPVLHKHILETARRESIPLQHAAKPRGTGTDANAMQLSRNGVATAVVGIPNRYMHTPAEMVALSDVEHAAALLAHVVRGIKPGADFTP